MVNKNKSLWNGTKGLIMYTSGKQFIVIKTGLQYIGQYVLGPDNSFYTGKTFNFKNSEKLKSIKKQVDNFDVDYNIALYDSL